MGPAGVWWRARLRRRWRPWIALAVLLGLGAGAGLACLAGARRTASSFDRIAQEVDYPDVVSSHGTDPAEAARVVAGFDGVVSSTTQVGFTGAVVGLDPTLLKYFIGSWGQPLRHGRPVLVDGRYPRPDRAREVVVVGRQLAAAGVEPGDELTVRFFRTDAPGTLTERFVVTGTGVDALEVAADAGQNRSAVYFTPAFTAVRAAELQAWSSTRFVTTSPPDDPGGLTSQLVSTGWSVDETRATAQSRIQDAVRPLIVTLGLLGALALVATLAVVIQAVGRDAESGAGERDTARALGFTRGQTRTFDVLAALSIGVPGALVAWATAVVLSPLFPIGSVRSLEPSRGLSVDLTVLAPGVIAVALVLVVSDRLRSRRADPAGRASELPLLARGTPLRPSMGTGVRFAVGSTVGQRRRFWGTVAFSAVALTLVVAGIGFVGALQRLNDDPVRYGAGWDLTARNAYGEIDPDELRSMIAGDPDIDGVAGGGVTPMLLDDHSVPAMPMLPITSELWPTLVEGAYPTSDDEVLVGADTLDEIDADIGDVVSLRSPYGEAGQGAAPVTIVGTAVFPSVEIAGVDPTRLGTGMAMTWAQFQARSGAIADRAFDRLPDLIFFDLAEGVDPGTIVERFPSGMPERSGIAATEWLPSLAPAEVRETDRATPLIWTVLCLLGLTVLGTVGLTLASDVRQRRRDYAVLRTMGFTRRQVLGSVAWQCATTVALALLIGLPLGVALGRTSWQLFAGLIGVIDTPVLPIGPLALMTVVAFVATGLVSAVPGLLLSAAPPATVLREK